MNTVVVSFSCMVRVVVIDGEMVSTIVETPLVSEIQEAHGFSVEGLDDDAIATALTLVNNEEWPTPVLVS